MVDLTVVFTGLILFTTPDMAKPSYSSAVMVMGGVGHDFGAHTPTLTIAKEFIKSINNRTAKIESFRTTLDGNTTVSVSASSGGKPGQATSFTDFLPSVTDAMNAAGIKNRKLQACSLAGEVKGCKYQTGVVRMAGGTLSAKTVDDNKDFYYFFPDNREYSYSHYMTSEAYWTGDATLIRIVDGNATTTIELTGSAPRVDIVNEPRATNPRHFGIFRLLWGMDNNGSLEGFPLPYAYDEDWLTGIAEAAKLNRGADPKNPQEKSAALGKLVQLFSPQRPLFCPPARQ